MKETLCSLGLEKTLGFLDGKSDIVLSPDFEPHEGIIRKGLYSKGDGECYKRQEYQKLYEMCKSHAREYRSPSDAKHKVVLTHPLHASLCDLPGMSDENKRVVADYNLDFLKLLTRKIPPEELEVIIFDTLPGYGAATNFLLKKGLINDVIFTKCNRGFSIKPKLLERLKDSTIHAGGCYNGACLSHSLSELSGIVHSPEQLWEIRDLYLEKPGIYGNISPKGIYYEDRRGMYHQVPERRVSYLTNHLSGDFEPKNTPVTMDELRVFF